jgi:hypothetical protein
MKITYLLGAGASAAALPVVKNIYPELLTFKEIFISNRSGSDEQIDNLSQTIREMEEDFIKSLEVILDELPKHASIDTYAKKLLITGNLTSYNRLKSIFSGFLIYTQLVKEVDRRYDSFFASILGTHGNDFIGDITILTWNYDFQLEKAYSAFSNSDTLASNQAMLNVSFPESDRFDTNRSFSVFKLNGTAGFNDSKWRNHYPVAEGFNVIDQRGFFKDLVKTYGYSRMQNTGVHSSLSFAWDNDNNKFYNTIANKINGTEIMVIIGYSVPFFNRIIDRKIIHAVAPTIRRVYVQDIYPDNVVDSLSSIWPIGTDIPIKVISSVDQFFVPPQL